MYMYTMLIIKKRRTHVFTILYLFSNNPLNKWNAYRYSFYILTIYSEKQHMYVLTGISGYLKQEQIVMWIAVNCFQNTNNNNFVSFYCQVITFNQWKKSTEKFSSKTFSRKNLVSYDIFLMKW